MTSSPVDALRAEAAAGNEPVAVPLGDDAVMYVKPVRKWRSSALRALKDGDFEGWAASSLTEDSAPKWLEVDPTIEEVEHFFTRWSEISGQDPGKSSASPRSSTRTRKPSRRT